MGCLAILVAGWLIYVGMMNWLAWHAATDWGERDRSLRAVLQPLPDLTIASTAPARITRFGYSFNVPWKEVQSEKDSNSADFLSFKDGDNMLIFNPAEALDGAKTMRGKTASENHLMTSVFGGKALSSNYDLMAAALAARPDDAHWWSGRKRNTQVFLLLVQKGLVLHRSSAFYAQGSPSLQGFQIGDPRVSPYLVRLELFDRRDRHYTILITGPKKQPASVTQSQINAIVASLTPEF